MTDKKIHGMLWIAEYLGISESTLRRWRHTPEGAFIEVGSMSNDCGGYGLAAWTYASSADNLKVVMEAKTSDVRRDAANARWHSTDVSSGANFGP